MKILFIVLIFLAPLVVFLIFSMFVKPHGRIMPEMNVVVMEFPLPHKVFAYLTCLACLGVAVYFNSFNRYGDWAIYSLVLFFLLVPIYVFFRTLRRVLITAEGLIYVRFLRKDVKIPWDKVKKVFRPDEGGPILVQGADEKIIKIETDFHGWHSLYLACKEKLEPGMFEKAFVECGIETGNNEDSYDVFSKS